MAVVYYHKRYGDPPLVERVRAGARIGLPLKAVRARLGDATRQQLIPFLGAGASLRGGGVAAPRTPQVRPDAAALDRICTEFALTTAGARRFVEIALQLAQVLDGVAPPDEQEALETAPSSWQLAMRLGETLRLEPLRPTAEVLQQLVHENPPRGDYLDIVKNVAGLLRLSKAVPQLLTVASYFNRDSDRQELCEKLTARFRTVTQVTPIQDVVATYARQFVDARNVTGACKDKRDYLVITTNYDRLIELELACRDVPTCVVTVDRGARVHVEFMPNVQDLLQLTRSNYEELVKEYSEDERSLARWTAKNFALQAKAHSLAMVYKMHGCPIMDESQRADNVVISDQDYVLFIQKNGCNDDLIPACVLKQVHEAGLLFLGYSFGDWNVRSLYQQSLKGRLQFLSNQVPSEKDGEIIDYLVMRDYSDSEDYYLQQWNVSVLVTELDDLAASLRPTFEQQREAS